MTNKAVSLVPDFDIALLPAVHKRFLLVICVGERRVQHFANYYSVKLVDNWNDFYKPLFMEVSTKLRNIGQIVPNSNEIIAPFKKHFTDYD